MNDTSVIKQLPSIVPTNKYSLSIDSSFFFLGQHITVINSFWCSMNQSKPSVSSDFLIGQMLITLSSAAARKSPIGDQWRWPKENVNKVLKIYFVKKPCTPMSFPCNSLPKVATLVWKTKVESKIGCFSTFIFHNLTVPSYPAEANVSVPSCQASVVTLLSCPTNCELFNLII